MIIKSGNSPQFFTLLGAMAQLALVLGIFLGRIVDAHPILNFISGMLVGFSLVGNLAFIIFISRKRS